MLGIDNDYYAYCLDEAVSMWGSHVTSELEKIEGKNDKDVRRKRERKLLALMQAPDELRFKPMRRPPQK